MARHSDKTWWWVKCGPGVRNWEVSNYDGRCWRFCGDHRVYGEAEVGEVLGPLVKPFIPLVAERDMENQEKRWVINEKNDDVSETIVQLMTDHPGREFVIGEPKETAIFSTDVMKRIGLVGIYELTR